MLELWNLVSVGLFDVLLGWLLELPRWIGLVAVGLATAALLTLIRKWTTDQERLARAAADLRRLKELRRAAKVAKDADAVERHKAVQGQIMWIKLKAEGRPLVAVMLPVALLATWAFERLAYYPPREDETIEVVAYFVVGEWNDPARSAENDVVHLVPPAGLRVRNGWVQPVRTRNNEPTIWDRWRALMRISDVRQPDPDIIAIWQLQGEAREQPYPLVFRWNEHSFQRDLLVGQRRYSPVATMCEVKDSVKVITEVRLREVRLFGVPGLGAWLPAWLVGYLMVSILFMLALKKVLRIF